MTKLPHLRPLNAVAIMLAAATMAGAAADAHAQAFSAAPSALQAAPAPRSLSTQRHVTTAPAQPAGNAYFNNRTGTHAQQRGSIGPWRLNQSASGGSAHPDGPRTHSRVTRSRPNTPSRATPAHQSAAPVATQRAVRTGSTHRINPANAWSARDSSGLHFGPRGHREPAPLPRTAALRAPQVPYFNPQVPTTLHRLPRRHRTAHYRARAWYEVNGHWYQRRGHNDYVLAIPPAGFVTDFLPPRVVQVELDGQTIFVGRHLSFRHHNRRYIALNHDEHVRALRASRGQPSASDEPLYFGQAADVYVDPVQGQTRQQFGNDLKACMQKAESQTGDRWQELPALVDEDSRERSYNALFGANRECLEVAGYVVY